MAKTVKPKVFDNVAKLDGTQEDGYVKKIVKDKVIVSWFVGNDYDEKGMIVKENRIEETICPSLLAITRRL